MGFDAVSRLGRACLGGLERGWEEKIVVESGYLTSEGVSTGQGVLTSSLGRVCKPLIEAR